MARAFSIFNQAAFQWIHGFAGRNIIADDIGIFFANWLPYLMGLGFIALAASEPGWRRKGYVFIEGALAVILSCGIVAQAIHFFYDHPRPFLFYGFVPLISESGASFPSGHASFFFALVLAAWYADRNWGISYLVLATLNGISRVYVGVHWPLDIIGGAVIGIVSGFIVHKVLLGVRRALYEEPALSAPAAAPTASPILE